MSKPALDRSTEEEVLITDSTLRRNIGYNMKRAFNVIKSDLVKTLKPHGLRMLTELQDLRLITRKPVQHDRRAHALHATKTGLAVYGQAVKSVEQHESVLFKGLVKQERNLVISILQQVGDQRHTMDKA